MATILKGKRKGQEVKIHQFCNDWFSIEMEDQARIIGPTSLKLNPEEIARVQLAAEKGQVGFMWKEYELLDNGTFKRRKRLRDA